LPLLNLLRFRQMYIRLKKAMLLINNVLMMRLILV
jgi:hypothetical protein